MLLVIIGQWYYIKIIFFRTYQVRITIESVEKDTVEKAYNTLLNALPKDYLVSD